MWLLITWRGPPSPKPPNPPLPHKVRHSTLYVALVELKMSFMKPSEQTRTQVSSSIESITCGVSTDAKDQAMILDVLGSGIYKDPIMAVLREYGANAWDANRMLLAEGESARPIKVHVPTYKDQTLRIRDFGPGLSKDDIQNVFSQYGRSTKRDSNVAVGMLGIGSKSGYAYSSSFTVTSWHGGTRLIYVATIDENNVRRLELMDERASDEESGVEISIEAKFSDLYDFERKAIQLYQHYEPRPEINVTLPPVRPDATALKTGVITDQQDSWGSKWIARMGCVPYRIDLEQLDSSKYPACLESLSGLVNLSIGDVDIAASREEVRYTAKTKACLTQKLSDLVDEYVVHALKEIETSGLSSWDKRLKLRVLGRMGLPGLDAYSDMSEKYVKVEYDPLIAGFTILHNSSVCTRFTVSDSTQLVIDDTDKPLAQYPYLRDHHYVVRGKSATDPSEVAITVDKLKTALLASKLDGIPIVMLSTFYHQAPAKKAPVVKNPKHRAKMFVLRADAASFYKPFSDYWETCERTPENDDIFVILNAFEPTDSDFYTTRHDDVRLAEVLGEVLPPVYGYKNTASKPISIADMKGRTYKDWRKTWLAQMAIKHRGLIERFFAQNPSNNFQWPTSERASELIEDLGVDHAITRLLVGRILSGSDVSDEIGHLAEAAGIKSHECAAGALFQSIVETYPLLCGSLRPLWKHDYSWENSEPKRAQWREYVKMVDERDALRAKNP